MNTYLLHFEGTIGDYIKFWRKRKNINSIELSKKIGKSDAYISHIENGRNKKPDYHALYEAFKVLGIDEEKIEDYLEHFGFISPEREAQEVQMYIDRMENGPSEVELEEWENRAEFEKGKYKSDNSWTADALLEDIIEENIKSINNVFKKVTEHDISNGYELIVGISKSFDAMSKNIILYNFMVKFFSENLSSLDNKGLIKVLNTFYEELNRIDRENNAFGKPRQRQLINKL